MGRYDDVLRFLEMNENRNEAGLNERILLNAEETDEIRKEHPDIPNDYIDYLTEVGWGDFRESQYMVYSALVDPEEIFGAEICATFKKRVLCFGDNFSGDPGGFLPDEHWKVVEIWHDELKIHETNMTFYEFIRNKMLIDENGNDLRNA